MSFTFFQVGGCVRDEFLGVKSKDIDFAVEAPSFDAMVADITARGGKIFLSKPEFQTVRAKLDGDVADFVLCRKESFYSDGRRPDSVTIGTIDDDLSRRDFTVNAIAKREDGTFHDPHNGVADLKAKILRCVGNTQDRFREDSLRMLRAIRFHITKDLTLSDDIVNALSDKDTVSLLKNVSQERIREELGKCFAFNTFQTIEVLNRFPDIKFFVFTEVDLWLKPTNEKK